MAEENATQETAHAATQAQAAEARMNEPTGEAPEPLGDRLGQAQERFGKAQESLESTIDQVREFSDQLTESVSARPLTTLLVVGAVSFALGYLLRG